MTGCTRVFDNLSHALAGWTGLLNRENALLHPYLTDTTASRTRGLFTIFCATAITLLTATECWNTDFPGDTGYGFLQIKFHCKTQVRSALLLPGTTSSAPAAKNIPENISENIADITVKPGWSTRTGIGRRMPELIIG